PRGAYGAAGARLADGRLGAAARRLLWRRRLQGYARPGAGRRRHPSRVVARSRRRPRPFRRRRRPGDVRALGAGPRTDGGGRAAAEGSGLRTRIGAGLGHPAAAYIQANRARLAFREDVMPLLMAHDALLCLTAPAPAPAGLGSTGDGSLCAPWSNAGVPAISLP